MEVEKMYEQRGQDIMCLLSLLKLELDEHAECAKKEGVDWGFVGDLSHAREKLIELLSFLAERDAEDIERTLADVVS